MSAILFLNMILDIPEPEDFEKAGLSCFNEAWEVATEFIFDYEDFLEYVDHQELELDAEVAVEYWKAAKAKIIRARATLQQGVEFIIKSKIAKISPYLLILNSPRDFPKKCEDEDTFFADFRTVDAQDLIKIYNTFSHQKIDTHFKENFHKLRKIRNATMHTVDKRINADVNELIYEVISMYNYFFKEIDWISQRRKLLTFSPQSTLYSEDVVDTRIIFEFNEVFKLLKNKELKSLFGINKKQRWYGCPNCEYGSRDSEIYPMVSQLIPNTASSTKLYCYVCQETLTIMREPCVHSETCKGNVITEDKEMCLTCYQFQE